VRGLLKLLLAGGALAVLAGVWSQLGADSLSPDSGQVEDGAGPAVQETETGLAEPELRTPEVERENPERKQPSTPEDVVSQLLPADRAERLAFELARIGESITSPDCFHDFQYYVPFEDYGPELLDITFGFDREESKRTAALVGKWKKVLLNKQELINSVVASLGPNVTDPEAVDREALHSLYERQTDLIHAHLEGPYKDAYDEMAVAVIDRQLYTAVPLLRRSGNFLLRADRGVERVYTTLTGDARWTIFFEVLRGEVPAFDLAHDELQRLTDARRMALQDFLRVF
jgi:hypothetical protein